MSSASNPDIAWRTSTYSASNGGCVEVATSPGVVLVRDSNDRGGPVLNFTARHWRAFLATVTG